MVNRLPFVRSPADHDCITRLYRALRRGEFSLAFAELCSGCGVERRELVELGVEIETALRRRGDNYAKSTRLGRIAVRVARRLGVSMDDAPSPRRQLVGMLFEWAHHRHELNAGDARTAWLELPGFIGGAAELAIATSMACGTSYETALAQLEADPDWLADMAFAFTYPAGLPVSITDVQDTIRFGMTAHGRLRDWLLREEVEKARDVAGARLAKFLGVADLHGMDASEAALRSLGIDNLKN